MHVFLLPVVDEVELAAIHVDAQFAFTPPLPAHDSNDDVSSETRVSCCGRNPIRQEAKRPTGESRRGA